MVGNLLDTELANVYMSSIWKHFHVEMSGKQQPCHSNECKMIMHTNNIGLHEIFTAGKQPDGGPGRPPVAAPTPAAVIQKVGWKQDFCFTAVLYMTV